MEILQFIDTYWPIFIAAGIFLDAISGYVPDKYLPYIGLIRRLVGALRGKPGLKMWLLLFVLPAFIGCATTPTGSGICDNVPEGQVSVICLLSDKIGATPEKVSAVLQIANVGLLQAEAYNAETGYVFVNQLIAEITKVKEIGALITYMDAILYVARRYELLPVEVQAAFVIINPANLGAHEIDVPLSDYDLGLIIGHLQKQRILIELYR